MAESTQLYRQIMAQLEAKRIELGLPMAGQRITDGRRSLDDLAGVADGYYAKALYPDTHSGRRAGWAVLDEFVIALFGRDFEVKISGEVVIPSLDGTKDLDRRYLERRHWRNRKFYKEQASRGGRANVAKHGVEHMAKIGRKANRVRWRKIRKRAKEITAVLDKATKGD